MPIWILVLVVTMTWYLNLIASASDAAVEDVKNPLESGRAHGISIMPVVVMAVFFVLVALGVDALLDTRWGSRVVVGAHVLFGIACAIGFVRNYRYIQRYGPDE